MNRLKKTLQRLMTIGLLLLSAHSFAAVPDAIKAQEGCFEVTFQYEEIEPHQEDYVLAAPKTSSVVEWVIVESDSGTQISLQHVLVTPPMIKHWKQIWTFEDNEFDVYTAPNQWEKRQLSQDDVAQSWSQEVRGVADNPRYACAAPWIETDEPSWTCQTWAAKPRRDKDRDDYNVLARTNTHRIVADGWVHEQQNTKLLVEDGVITPLVTEVGHNTYRRIDDSECAEAAGWWDERTDTWNQIQRAWNDVSEQYETYTVDSKRGIFPLWIRLFWIARRPLPPQKYDALYSRAHRIIDRHLNEASPVSWSVPYSAIETD